MKKESHHTEEAKQKQREAKLGKIPWNKNLTKEEDVRIKSVRLGTHHTEEAKKKMRDNHWNMVGRNHPMYGKHQSKESKQKNSESQLGEKNHGWKGGYEERRKRAEEKRRGFGFVPLNDNFIGAERHHIDKELVLHIPKELHRSVYHNLYTGQGMEEINNLACEYVYGIKTEEEI